MEGRGTLLIFEGKGKMCTNAEGRGLLYATIEQAQDYDGGVWGVACDRTGLICLLPYF